MWLLAFAFVIAVAAPAVAQQVDVASSLAQSCSSAANGDNAECLLAMLRDRSGDEDEKQEAAHRLGCLGGDQAVRQLEGALRDASPTTRQSIARALGDTRSRLAVPVLIAMFRSDSARDEVCDALITLTHRTWCDGGDDDVALRRAWRRWWSQMKSHVEIYQSDSCRDTGEHRAPMWNW
jgi:HEAT repeats